MASKPTMVKQPRVSIVSTRQTISSTIRMQRRETRFAITSLATKASTSKAAPVLPVESAKSVKPSSVASTSEATFARPSALPVRKTMYNIEGAHGGKTMSNTAHGSKPMQQPEASHGGKCKYCDKSFAKAHGLTTHLLENCTKIPAAARRLLLKNEQDNTRDNANSKQESRRKTLAAHHDIDSLSKYSRFFVNVTNEGASESVASVDEKMLNDLRAELRKEKGITGIIRTPRKTIQCHICKKLFLDCVEYAEHIENH